MKDQKAALGNASKPDITHVRTAMLTYISRACEYGSAKYERGNYIREAGDTKADFIRFGAYLRSVVSHVYKCLDSMERHRATDPDLEDVEGMLRAAFAADPDVTPGAKVGASGLPHVAHAAAGLMMAIVQATEYGLLPADPGQPWAEGVKAETYDPLKAVLIVNGEIVTPTDSWQFEQTTDDLVNAVAEGMVDPEPKPDVCPHGRPIGMACKECGGWARREYREG